MPDLFALSTKVIDSGATDSIDGPINRITQELSELGNGIAMVESFSHSILFETDEGLVVFDTSGGVTGVPVVEAIRGWSKKPFHTVVYTHGHLDHIGGSGAFMADARAAGGLEPRFVGHEKVIDRMRRYRTTSGYNQIINSRQFRGFTRRGYSIGEGTTDAAVGAIPARRETQFLPEDAVEPNTVYSDHTSFRIGGLHMDLHHAKGETDDHTWAWIPEHKAICVGDFFIWNFPNCGNPQKVQRYPLEWAQALRDMSSRNPEFMFPAHGLPVAGADRIRSVLDSVATVLETLVQQSLEMMNSGAALDDMLHSIHVPAEELEKPWMKPFYDEPEFVVRNIWRLYGGWYDGNPANLKPAPHDALAVETAALAGGVDRLAKRAKDLADIGEMRLACHLIEMAYRAEPDNVATLHDRADIYQQRRDSETSLMAKGIFGTTATESRERAEDLTKN